VGFEDGQVYGVRVHVIGELMSTPVLQEVYKGWSIFYFLNGMIPSYYATKGSERSADFTNIGVLKGWIDSVEGTPPPPEENVIQKYLPFVVLLIIILIIAYAASRKKKRGRPRRVVD